MTKLANGKTKLYKVATYWLEGMPLQISCVNCYTRYYSSEWDGFYMFEVEARSSHEAKRQAARMRIAYEKARAA